MKYINVEPNVKIAVEDINSSGEQVVVFIHGWPLSSQIFEYQMNILPYYGFRVVAIDLRGFGKSDVTAKGYYYDDLATDVYRVIKHMNLQDITIAGFSMGGAIAIRYMTLYQGYAVKKLALLAAAAPRFTEAEGFPYGMTKEEVDILIDSAYRDRPQMVAEFGKNFFYLPHSEQLKEWFKLIGYGASGIGTIQTAYSLRDEDLQGELPFINVKTGIFHGKKDMVCPYEFAEILHNEIKSSRLYTFENSGHGIFYDELEDFNSRFIEFLMEQ